MAKDEKVGARLPDNISKLNVSQDKMRVGQAKISPDSPIDSILSTVFREMTPTDPDTFDAKIIDVITDPDTVASLMSTKLGRIGSGTERVYKIRADLYAHLEDPFFYDENTKERIFYMSLHPDAFLDYGTSDAVLSVGDLVECKYLNPKERDGVLITEVIESSANAGAANSDMSTVAKDAVKSAYKKTGNTIKKVWDYLTGEEELPKFKVPGPERGGASINGSPMTPEQIEEFGQAARLLVPNAVRMSSDYQLKRPHPRLKDKKGRPIVKSHKGIDLAVDGKVGHPLTAPMGGVIDTADGSIGSSRPGGNQVSIVHDNGYRSLYLHCHTVDVQVGTRVKRGDVVGTLGNSGIGSGPHLHYSLMTKGRRKVDPKPVLMSWLKQSKEVA